MNTSPFLITVFLLITSCNQTTNTQNDIPQNTRMPHFKLSPETAHPKAKILLNEEFYWSSIEESGPFGNDDGWDAVYGFVDWRASHPKTSPVVYLNELLLNWGYPTFDLYEMNEGTLRKYIESNSYSLLVGQDNAIVAVGFGQFALEGKIEDDIFLLTKAAIKRELMPSILHLYDSQYGPKRQEQLTKMLAALDKMKEESN